MSVLSAIPAELLTGGISAVLSFGASIFAMKAKQKDAQQRMLLERHGASEASRVRAEGGDAEDRAAKRWTRRAIALTATVTILVFPMLAPLFGLDVVTGWTEMSGGFWPFFDPTSHMIWHMVQGGIVVTPLHTHVLMAIIGFYFGSSAAENARI